MTPPSAGSAPVPSRGARARPGTDRRRTRRAVLGTGLAAAAGVLGGPLPPGPPVRAARPARAASAPAVLTFLPSQSWPTAIGPDLWELLHGAMAPFLRRHPGIEVRLFANQGYQGATQAAMLAGSGPDVFSDWILPPFVEHGLMLDLTPFLRADHLDVGIFPPGEMAFFREVSAFSPAGPGSLYAVPAYLHTEAYAVNLSILDALRLPHPEPEWTVREWVALWERATGRAGRGRQHRFGTDLDFGGYDYGYNMVTPYVLWGYGGEYVDPRNPERCFLASPGALECGRTVFRLLWDGVATTPVSAEAFARGVAVCTHNTCTCGFQLTEAEAWRGFDWDYFEDPVWPVRRTSYAASDFYGIWSGTRHPEAAWLFLKWLAFEADWQRVVMRTALAGPNQARLWEEWAAVVRAFAPALARKNLEAFAAPVRRGEPYFGRLFRFAATEVKAIIANYSQLLVGQQLSVDEAFPQMAAEIDAAQKAGAAAAAAARRASALAAGYVARAERAPGAVDFPPPPRDGVGVPPVDAPAMVRADRRTGRVTLLGVGQGVAGATDSMTFAGQSFVRSRGSFACRLTAIESAAGGILRPGAKIGLMARSDLSDAAGEVGIEVAVARGVHLHTRPFPGTALGDQRPPSASNPAGLIGPRLILSGRPAGNYLLRPVWLRLDFDVERWIAYTSLDGRTWTQAFEPVGMAFAGCWIGLFATAHGGPEVRAVFDRLEGFWPDTFVTVGVAPS